MPRQTAHRASTRVVETVATARNEEPTDLPVLADVFDPDSLDTLIATSSSKSRPEVTFDWPAVEFEITVCPSGVALKPLAFESTAGHTDTTEVSEPNAAD